MREVLDRSGLRREALALGGAEGAARLAGLAALERMAGDIARRDPALDAVGLVRRLVGLSEVGHRGRIERSAERIGVQVSTIHQAKGLEFDAVFVIGFVASRMPGRDRQRTDIPDELLPETIQRGRDAHIAEKRRLVVRRAHPSAAARLPRHVRDRRAHPAAALAVLRRRAELRSATPEPERVGGGLAPEVLAEIGDARAELERTGQAAAAALAVEAPDANALMDAARAALDELVAARARALAPPLAPVATASPPPAVPPAIEISPSDLQTYRTCPLRYRFARVDRIPQPDRPSGRIGTAAHLALEAHYRPDGDGGDGDALVARFEMQLSRLGVASTPEGEQALRRGRDSFPSTTSASREAVRGPPPSSAGSPSRWAATPCAAGSTASTATPAGDSSSSTTRPAARPASAASATRTS